MAHHQRAGRCALRTVRPWRPTGPVGPLAAALDHVGATGRAEEYARLFDPAGHPFCLFLG